MADAWLRFWLGYLAWEHGRLGRCQDRVMVVIDAISERLLRRHYVRRLNRRRRR